MMEDRVELSDYEKKIIELKKKRELEFSLLFKQEDSSDSKLSDILPVQPKARVTTNSVETESQQPRKRKRSLVPEPVGPARKSSRLTGKEPSYVCLDDDFVEPSLTWRRKSVGHIPTPRVRLARPVEYVENFDPKAIVYGSKKVWSGEGTCCHQCRQKTLDQKSKCYSPYCSGVRGQFCGFCLQKRYGEDVAVVLKDKNWKCPPCRKICNCSICRRHYGKPPTGCLYRLAAKAGFKSVNEYLLDIGDAFLLEEFKDMDNPEGQVTIKQELDDDGNVIEIKQEPIDDDDAVKIKQEVGDGIDTTERIEPTKDGKSSTAEDIDIDNHQLGQITVKQEPIDVGYETEETSTVNSDYPLTDIKEEFPTDY